MNTSIFFFCLLIGINTRTWAKAAEEGKVGQLNQHHSAEEKQHQNNNIQCRSIFKVVGDHCLFVDKDLFGTWQEIRELCHDLGGDLPNLKDANFLADIDDYFHNHYLDDVSYWVGSNDQVTEGIWQWANDNSRVKLGTPLWGDLADKVQQPTGGYSENCGVLLQGDHYYMHDAACSESYSLLCEQFDYKPETTTGRTTDADTTIHRTTGTSPTYVKTTGTTGKHTTPTSTNPGTTGATTAATTTDRPVECPSPYELIDGKCLFINTLAKYSWETHKISCLSLAGHMAKLDDANVLGAVYDYLEQSSIKQEFWIGASDQQQEGKWFWHDGTYVHLGTPFWGDNGAGPQNPDGGVTNNCAYITHLDHYFFNDGNCDSSRYVICQIDI